MNSQFEPLLLGTQTHDRLAAGTVMARALGSFHAFNKMKTFNNKITNSNLSATLFTRFVLDKDSEAKEKWKADNNLSGDVTKASLRTDQEWCHLFGHGDGGPEELGNFVSGSKHCNTEQIGH